MTEFQTGVLPGMTTADGTSIVFITAPSIEVAEELAQRIVDARLAACVNILPGVRSIYRWEGKVCSEAELLLIAKTTSSKIVELGEFIRLHHPYDTPEFVAFQADAVAPRYAAWVEAAVRTASRE